MRLFIAINFNQEISKAIGKTMKSLKAYAVKGNFTREENLHLTLVFIGETSKEKEIKQIMNSINAEAFNLKLKGLGKFPRKGGHIYWMGVEDNEQLSSLAEQLRTKLIAAGFPIENRPFKAHLTLGRQVILDKNFDLGEFEKAIKPLNVEVNKISLMKSERIQGRLVYTEIYSKPLG